MKNLIIFSTLTIVLVSGSAFAQIPDTIAKAVQTCCEAALACCQFGLECCAK